MYKKIKGGKIQKKIPVYLNNKIISFTNPARARKLIKQKKVYPFFNLDNKFSLKLIKKKEEKMANFVVYRNDIINLEKIERIELKEDKIMFFMDSVTARDNWKFETKEAAKDAYKKLIDALNPITIDK